MLKTKLILTAAILGLSTSVMACSGADKTAANDAASKAAATTLQTANVQAEFEAAAPVLTAPAVTVPVQTAPVQAAPVQTAPVQVAQASYNSGEQAAVKAATPAAAYEGLLAKRISKGAGDLNLFDYSGTKSSGDDQIVRDYIAYLTSQNPDTMNADDATVYWANLYNAETIRLIIDNYPVKSIRKIGGFTGPWKKNTLVINGEDVSLNDIEHNILRVKYPSPYVHYMVNCASIGCPNLLPTTWKAGTYKAERIKAAEAYINSPRGVAIKGNKLEASSIFNWFKEDFGGKKGILPHIRKHAGPELAAAIDGGATVGGFEYNWNLNE